MSPLFNISSPLILKNFIRFKFLQKWLNLRPLFFKKNRNFLRVFILKIFKKRLVNFKRKTVILQRGYNNKCKFLSKYNKIQKLFFMKYVFNFFKKMTYFKKFKDSEECRIVMDFKKLNKLFFYCSYNESLRFFFKNSDKQDVINYLEKLSGNITYKKSKKILPLVRKSLMLIPSNFYNSPNFFFLDGLYQWVICEKKNLFLPYFIRYKRRQWFRVGSPYFYDYYFSKESDIFDDSASIFFSEIENQGNYYNEQGIDQADFVSKYKKIFKLSWSVFNPNKKSRLIKLRNFEHNIFNSDSYSAFKLELFKFFKELARRIRLSVFLKKKTFEEDKKFFFIKIKAESKYNSITFSNGFRKFILRRSTKSLGIKTRKFRRDIIKTKFLFKKVFYVFKKFAKSKFRIKDFHNYSFIFSLHGDVLKTSKIFKYVISKSRCKIFSILDETAVPHNGCRAPKRRRKKNKGRNKYAKKLKNN